MIDRPRHNEPPFGSQQIGKRALGGDLRAAVDVDRPQRGVFVQDPVAKARAIGGRGRGEEKRRRRAVPGDRRAEREGAVKIHPPGHFGGVQRLTDRRLTREMNDEIGTQARNQRVDRSFVEKIGDGRRETPHGRRVRRDAAASTACACG